MIDSTGEGKMNAAYKLRVKITRPNDLCFFLVIFECMRGGDGELKAGFTDCAVHEMMKRARLSNKAVFSRSGLGLSSPQRSAQEGPSDRPPPTIVFFYHREPASLRRTCF